MNNLTNRERAINTLFDTIEMARDNFKASIKEIMEKYNAEVKTIERDINPNSHAYKQQLEEAKTKKENNIIAEREANLTLCLEAIEDLEYWEKQRVLDIDDSTLSKLNNILPENITRKEMDILVEKFGNKNYWVDKALLDISQKAGITECIAIEPSIDIKLSIMHSLAENLTRFMNEYDGTMKSEIEVLLADSVLQRAKRTYTNNCISSFLNDRQIVELTFDNIGTIKNESERALALHRAMNNANDNVKNMLIAKLSTSNICGESSLVMAGLKESIDLFRATDGAREYAKAENQFNDILIMEKPEQMAGAIIDNVPKNKYLKAMLESELRANDNVKVACEIANIEFASKKETKYNALKIADIE